MGRDFEIEPSAEAGPRRVVRVRVPHDLRWFEGHFPGHPVVPGIAQLVPLVYDPARRAWPDLPAPTAIRRLKFLEALAPGDELEVELTRGPDALRFEIRRGALLCTRGTLSLR